MIKINLYLLILLFTFSGFSQNTGLEDFLKSQPEIESVKQIPGNDFFGTTYKIMVKQEIDHKNPAKGYFLQRVIIADKGKSNPVTLITEGYAGAYAENPKYINELSPILNSNQVCIEHRYFGESWPKPVNWKYLTVANAAADHHKIIGILKRYYTGKWISTGISKGGQTVVYHRWLYPDDVDFSVAYVCPLNFGVEDGRHEIFIRDVPGTAEQRQKIKDFQLAVLKKRKEILPKLINYSEEKKFTYNIPIDAVLDFCVLEYSFSFWQWGYDTGEIPDKNADAGKLFSHLVKVAGPSYFAIEGIEPIKSFFVQAAHELGYYGYDTKPFEEYLSVKTAHNYLKKIFLPGNVKIRYRKTTAKKVKRYINSTDSKILFIYGGFDPWFASSFEVPAKNNFLKIVKQGGSHSTRIGNLPENQKQQVKEKLTEWLGKPVNL